MFDPRQFAPWVSADAREAIRTMAATPAASPDLAGARRHYDAFNQAHLDAALALYPVDVEEQEINGVLVHAVTPRAGASDPRILLSLHGGAFMWGAGAGALLEAVPVAAVTGMTVVAIDYRLAPEHVFPAAVDDVLAVFRHLLGTRPAGAIGVFGTSAGAILTAQVVARALADGTPVPGAIAMLHGAPIEFAGDAAALASTFDLTGKPSAPPQIANLPYLAGVDPRDPLAMPGESAEILARFPPSLSVTATRDFAAGASAMMHRRLLAAGADSHLVLFEGLYHAHHMATGLPEARETFAILDRFFKRHLVAPAPC